MRALVLPALLVHFATATVVAKPINWQIDSARSSITLAANYSDGTTSVPVIEQAPGSMTTSMSGEVPTNVEIVGGKPVNMSILPSSLTPVNNGVWRPGPGGSDTLAPAFAAGRLFDPAAFGDIYLTLYDGTAAMNSNFLLVAEQSTGNYNVIGVTRATATAKVSFRQYVRSTSLARGL